MKKIYISDNAPLGERCNSWAKKNLPQNVQIAKNLEECDVFFSLFYNRIIPSKLITPNKNFFNFHAGILPQYRGSGTINWAIINQEKETGISLHKMDSGIDTGDLIEIRKISIDENDTAHSLFMKLEETAFLMFKFWFQRLISAEFMSFPQDNSLARTYSRDEMHKAKDLTRFVRAFEFLELEKSYFYNKCGEKIYLSYEKNKS